MRTKKIENRWSGPVQKPTKPGAESLPLVPRAHTNQQDKEQTIRGKTNKSFPKVKCEGEV